ncbi:MAG: PKD domain-containing protein, partial [Gemmataceae bacterium]
MGQIEGEPNTSYELAFFDLGPDEGTAAQATPAGSFVVTTNSAGLASFNRVVPTRLKFDNYVGYFVTRLDPVGPYGITFSGYLDGGKAVPAAILGIPTKSEEGTPFTLTAFSAADPGEGGNIGYRWTVFDTNLGQNVAIPGQFDPGFTYTPPNDTTLQVTLEISTSDGQFGFVGPVTIPVFNVKPTLDVEGPSEVDADPEVPYVYKVTANDPGVQDVLTYYWSVRVGSPSGPLVAESFEETLAWIPEYGGLTFVRLSVFDGTDTVSRTIPVVVNGGPALASIISTPNEFDIIDEGTPIRARAALNELVRAETMQFEWIVRSNGVLVPYTDIEDGAIEFTPNDNGFYQIDLTIVANGERFVAAPKVLGVGNAKPQVTIANLPEDVPAGRVLTLSALVNDRGTADTHKYQWRVVGPAVVRGGTGQNFSFSTTALGDYAVVLTVTDDDNDPMTNSGRTEVVRRFRVVPSSVTVTFTVPTTLEEGIAADFVPTVTSGGTTFRYDWELTDGIRTVRAESVSGTSGLTNTPFVFNAVPWEGGDSYRVRLIVTAPNGEIGYAETGPLSVVNRPPVASLSVVAPPTGGYREGQTIRFTMTGSDPGGAAPVFVQWQLNGVDVPATGADVRYYDLIPPDNGNYTLTAIVKDPQGESTTTARTINVGNVPPRVRILTSDETTGDGLQVGLQADTTDDGSADSQSYVWTIRRNGTVISNTTSSGGRNVRFSSAVAGTYTAELTATDDDGGIKQTTAQLLLGTAGADNMALTSAQASSITAEALLVLLFDGADKFTPDASITLPLQIDGGAGNDNLRGASGPDVLRAGPGNNILDAGAGDDELIGGGDDQLSGGLGRDLYRPHFSVVRLFETGNDADIIDLALAPAGVTFDLSLTGGIAQPVFTLDSVTSTLAITGGFEELRGSPFGDTFTSKVTNSRLDGGAGADDLTIWGTGSSAVGGSGFDRLSARGRGQTVDGGEGDDSFFIDGEGVQATGGIGDDTLFAIAPSVRVTMDGGAGDDRFTTNGGAEISILGGLGDNRIDVNGTKGVKIVTGPGAGTSDIDVFGSVTTASSQTKVTINSASDIDIFGTSKQDKVTINVSSDIDIFGNAEMDLGFTKVDRARIVSGFGNSAGATSGMKVNIATSTDIDIFGTTKKDVVVVNNSSDIDIFGGPEDNLDFTNVVKARITAGFGDS